MVLAATSSLLSTQAAILLCSSTSQAHSSSLAPASAWQQSRQCRRRRRVPSGAHWEDWRASGGVRLLARIVKSYAHGLRESQRQPRPLLVRSDLAGQYEDSFADVDKHLLDYFTYKAVRTVLVQLYEMNPSQYSWFYNFVVENKPQDSKVFLSVLVKERQELCERVMVTRLHLYNKWIKKHDHAKMYQAISDQNLELLRERLVQTVKWTPEADDKLES